MKKGKWIVPVCAGLILALGVAAVLIFSRAGRVSLYDYARSLPDESYFVSGGGLVYQAEESAEGEVLVHPTEQRAGPEVQLPINTPDEQLSLWEAALRIGGGNVLLRQDGSLWLAECYYITEEPVVWHYLLAPFFSERPEELPPIENELTLDELQLRRNVLSATVSPEPDSHDGLSWVLSARCDEKWRQVSCGRSQAATVENGGEAGCMLWICFAGYDGLFGVGEWRERRQLQNVFPADTGVLRGGVDSYAVPAGLYRLEIYEGKTLRYVQEMRMDWKDGGLVLTGE